MATTVAIAGFCTFFLLLIVSAGWQRNAVEGVLRGLEASSFSSVPYKVTDLERVKTRPSCRGRKTRRLACRKTNKNAFVFSPNIEPADGRLLRVGLDLKVCGRDSIDIVVVRTSLKHEQFGSQHVVRVKKRLGNLKEAVYFTIHRDDYTSFDHLRIDERNKTCLVSMTVENGETSRKFLWQAVIDGQLNTLGGFRW